MAKVSAERFLELTQTSGLVDQSVFNGVIASLKDALTGKIPDSPSQIGRAFVAAGALTSWQSGMLLRGKHKGFRLGKYLLLDHLGSGGMSNVYLAEHTLMRRRVAIKVLPRHRVTDSSYLARFRREAEAAAQLDHPNIVRAYDIDQEKDVHYFIMEYIEGRDFLRIVREEGPLEFRRATDYIKQVAEGLQHAHTAGLIHRDIKPGNCLVDQNDVVKLLDMGLAKFSQDDGPSLTLMHDENVLGTADYLAPEQARNSHEVDSRADIYGLGCTMHFLLTGRPPFAKGTLSERLVKHQTQPPPSIYKVREDAPREIVEVCQEMMIKMADRRIQTAGEVAERLRAWLDKSAAPSRPEPASAPPVAQEDVAARRRAKGPPKPPVSAPKARAKYDESDLGLAPLSDIGGVTPPPPTDRGSGSSKKESADPPAPSPPAVKTRQRSPAPDQRPAARENQSRARPTVPAGDPGRVKAAAAKQPAPAAGVPEAPSPIDSLEADLFEIPSEPASPLLMANSPRLGNTMPWWVWAGLATGSLALLVLVVLAMRG